MIIKKQERSRLALKIQSLFCFLGLTLIPIVVSDSLAEVSAASEPGLESDVNSIMPHEDVSQSDRVTQIGVKMNLPPEPSESKPSESKPSDFRLSESVITNSRQEKRFAGGPFVEGQLGNAIIGLVFVVGMVLLSAWFVRRTNLVRYGTDQKMKVLSSFPVGNKEKLMLIRLGETELLLGVTAHTIQTLHVLPSVLTEKGKESQYSQADDKQSRWTAGNSGLFSDKLKEIVERGRLS